MKVADGNSTTHYADYGWDAGATQGGVCANDATPCTIANEVADCGGSNTCLVAPQSGPWHPVVGAFEISFYAQAVNTSTGAPQVTVATSRTGSSWSASHTFTLTNDGQWHQYTLPFTGGDVAFTGGQNQGRLDFKLTASNGSAETGAAIYIDDVYYGKAATSTTGFRNEVVTSLQAINPGSLRYGTYNQLGTNDAAMKARAVARQEIPGRQRPAPATICTDPQLSMDWAIGRGLTLRRMLTRWMAHSARCRL